MKKQLLFTLFLIGFLMACQNDNTSTVDLIHVEKKKNEASFAAYNGAPDEDSLDILADVKAMNKAKGAPKTKFKAGHVTLFKYKDKIKKTDNGYVIDLPASGLIPSPTIYEDQLYVSGGFGSKQFYSFEAFTGAVNWSVNLDDDGPSSAVIEDGIAVFNTESCTIFAMDIKTGKQLWSYWLGDPLMSTPSIANGYVFTAYPAYGASIGGVQNNSNYNNNNIIQQSYINEAPLEEVPSVSDKQKDTTTYKGKIRGTHVMICMELATGKIVWQKWIDGDIMSAPVVDKDQLYVTTFPGTFYQFDQKTGEIMLAKANRATSAPVIAGNDIFMSRRVDGEKGDVSEGISVSNKDKTASIKMEYNRRAAPYLDATVQRSSNLKNQAMAEDAANGFTSGAPANSGATYAESNIGQSNVSSLQAFQGSRVYNRQGYNYNVMGDQLVCTNAETGVLRWEKDIEGDMIKEGGTLATAPIGVNGKIIVATLLGDIIVSDEKTGKELQRYEIKEPIRSQPIVHKGWIFVTTAVGKLHAINTKDSELTGWPTWGGNAGHSNQATS